MKKTIGLILLIQTMQAFAQTPLFSIIPQGTLPTTITSTGTATVMYTVKNNTPYALAGLGLGPLTPFGVTQSTAGTNTPPTCTVGFTLDPQQSCTLVLTIDGSQLENGGAFGGPEVCFNESLPSRCSVPAAGSQLNVTLVTVGSIYGLAVGYSGTTSLSPFFAQTQDLGVTWTAPSFPGSTMQAIMIASACGTLEFCVISGKDMSDNTSFLTQTIDGGDTWTQPTIPVFFLKNHENNNLLGLPEGPVACLNQQCVSGGIDSSGNGILLQTLDTGTTWNAITLPPLVTTPPLTDSIDPDWTGGSCDSAVCVFVGTDVNNLFEPVLAQALPNTSSWNYVDLSSFPTIWADGTFTGVDCLGQQCVAVGYNLTSDIPIITYTQNAGSAWQEVDLSSSFPGATLAAVSCALFASTDSCFAVGASATATPFMLESQTPGTWTSVNLNDSTSGDLSSVSCSASICLAGGSDNSGQAVLFQATSTSPTFSPVDISAFITQGAISTVTCHDQMCIAAGGAINPITFYFIPVLLQTLDGGTTWSEVTITNGPTTGAYVGSSGPAGP